jgi:formate dehydrogenase gamma subunit
MRKSVVLFITLWIGASAGAWSQSNATCLACHGDASLTMERAGKEISIAVDGTVLQRSAHRKLQCIACHTRFDPESIPHRDPRPAVNCLTCHKDVPRKHAFHPQLTEAINAGEEPAVSCKDCHGTHNVVSPKVPGSKFHVDQLTASCGECHSDVTEKFAESAHGRASAAHVTGAPNCITCHTHPITSNGGERSELARKVDQEKMCLSCHLDNPDVRARTSPTAGFIAAYEKSVHGSALLGGNGSAANCVDCHGSHEMKKGLEPSSLVNKLHIPETCSKCHSEIAHTFAESVHGAALSKGNKDAPACTDCHGEHNILKHTDPRSPVASANVSSQVCSPCHSSVKLTAKYGLPENRSRTFADSYHGLAIRGGSVEVANCASCHGAHNILPSSDARSMVNKANLAETCGKCHPGANQRFAVGSVHIAMTAEEDPLLYWIAFVYIVLIVTLVGGMFFHNVLDFLRKSRRKLMIRRGQLIEEHHPEPKHRLYLRMTVSERLQHGSLAVSFTLLVITGFMLRYPEAWWVVSIRNLSDNIFDLRSLIHRISAVVMIAASVYHIVYLSATDRGRALVRDLLPRRSDLTDAVAVLRYNLGLSQRKPKFGRFSYIEKSEYWALVWGTVVMALTGLIMWFDNTFIGLFTKLGYDVARTIHFYEAWLATLAIIVWHFYFVIFNPDVYPMNLSWLTGSLTAEEMRDEHPLELEALTEIDTNSDTDVAEPSAESDSLEESSNTQEDHHA